MNRRAKRRAQLEEGLDAILAVVDAADRELVPDLERLTPAEQAVLEALLEQARASGEGFHALSYDSLCQVRALHRKATGVFGYTEHFNGNHADYRDSLILRAMNEGEKRVQKGPG